MMKRILVGSMLALSLLSTASQADWYGELGYAEGGDKFDVIVTNEHGSELDKSVSLGGGFNMELGGTHNYTELFTLQYGFGYKFDSVVAGDDEVSFKRYPINAIGLFDLGDTFQLGAGLTYEYNPKLNLIDMDLGSYGADDALGLVLQMGWRFGGMRILLRHTQIDYQFAGGKLDGNNTGLHFGFVW